MGKRHEARLWAVQFLFQRDLNDSDLETALADFWAQDPMADDVGEQKEKHDGKIRGFTEGLVRGVMAHAAEIDAKLQAYAEHWDVGRMGAVERNVMRVALYEMFHCPDIPPVVSINEAVEVAKDLSNAESARFVNGILDRALRDIDRPLREASDGPDARGKE